MTIKRTQKKSLKIPTEIPTSTVEYFKRKPQTLLTDIGGYWYLNTSRNTKIPLKNPRLGKKKVQTKGKLIVARDHWKY